MIGTPAAAPGRSGLLCALVTTVLLATTVTLVDAVAGPKAPLSARTTATLETATLETAARAPQARQEATLPAAPTPQPLLRPRPGAERLGPALGVAEIVEPADSAELKRAFERAGFRLDAVRRGAAAVPRLYVAALPGDLPEIGQVETRKRVFLRSVLPLVLLANEELRQRRARLLDLAARIEAGAELPVGEQAWLDALAEHYELEHGDLDGLKRRVAEIPPSLALAQAIVESGWGTSRFALEGNALFGQRTWAESDPALVPEENRSVRVKAFIDLMESVRAYMHNLNTHPAYAALRRERARLAAAGEAPAGGRLVHALETYAEIDGYVAKLQALMRQNKLADLDGARLRSRPMTAVRLR